MEVFEMAKFLVKKADVVKTTRKFYRQEANSVVVNKAGGKATKLTGWPTILPPNAMERIIRVLTAGDIKYGRKNMDKMPVMAKSGGAGHLDHALMHFLKFQQAGRVGELEHGVCRAIMALEKQLKLAARKRKRTSNV